MLLWADGVARAGGYPDQLGVVGEDGGGCGEEFGGDDSGGWGVKNGTQMTQIGALIFADWIGLAFRRNRSIKGYGSSNHTE